MEINKQLFEDVLSGKLKGTFVLRNGRKISSNKLICNNSYYSATHPYGLLDTTYTSNGRSSLYGSEFPNDIIDFIPDADMKQNELTIEIPDGKTVDWDESKKQNKIVLKDKQLTYEEVCRKLFQPNGGYYICGNGEITKSFCADRFLSNANNADSKHQLECILAKNKLANVAKYLNSLSDETTAKYYIYNGYNLNVQQLVEPKFNLGLIMFKSAELAQQAIEILGEETVKLALEPLGI